MKASDIMKKIRMNGFIEVQGENRNQLAGIDITKDYDELFLSGLCGSYVLPFRDNRGHWYNSIYFYEKSNINCQFVTVVFRIPKHNAVTMASSPGMRFSTQKERNDYVEERQVFARFIQRWILRAEIDNSDVDAVLEDVLKLYKIYAFNDCTISVPLFLLDQIKSEIKNVFGETFEPQVIGTVDREVTCPQCNETFSFRSRANRGIIECPNNHKFPF